MSDVDSAPSGGAPGRWRFSDVLLAELAAIVVLLALAVAIWGARALPWTTSAEQVGADNHDATAAAQKAVLTFLDVDYRTIDDHAQRVIDLSTTPFRDQFAYGSTDLRIATVQARSVSEATVRTIGLKQVTDNTAEVLVGADTVLRTTATRNRKATETCPHAGARCNRYRFAVTLKHVDDRWLLSNLAEVP